MTRGGLVDDQLNVPLEDAELLAEVELTTNLIIAASEAEEPLTQAQVDELLGLRGPERAADVPGQTHGETRAPDPVGAGDTQVPAQHQRPD